MHRKKYFPILLFIFIVIIELIVIIFLYQRNFSHLTPINSSDITELRSLFYSQSSKYMVEPQAGKAENHARPEWIKKELNITINDDTLNAATNYSINKDRDTYRIITLGDSLTYGFNVSTADNYPSQLERILNENMCGPYKKMEVINLAVQGQDLFYMNERYKKRGIKYDPDAIVIIVKEDDLIFPSELIYYQLSKDPSPDEDVSSKWKQFLGNINSAIPKKEIIEYEIEALQRIRESFDGKLVILAFRPPFMHDGKDPLEKFSSQEKTYVHYMSFLPESLLQPDKHPSEEGYLVISENVSNFLLDTIICP